MIVGPLPVRTRRGDVGRWSANWAPANRALVSDLVAPVGLVALVVPVALVAVNFGQHLSTCVPFVP